MEAEKRRQLEDTLEGGNNSKERMANKNKIYNGRFEMLGPS